jgi:hypothetical protein
MIKLSERQIFGGYFLKNPLVITIRIFIATNLIYEIFLFKYNAGEFVTLYP